MNTKTYLEIHNLVFTFLSENCKDLTLSKISELASKVVDICDLKSDIFSNLKPSWSEAPPWANWLAMDKNGKWYWYGIEPKLGKFSWCNPFCEDELLYSTLFEYEEIEQSIHVIENNALIFNWEETLEQRPE